LSQCAKRGSRGAALNLGAPNDVAFTGSPCPATNLKSTFNYDAVFRTTAKIDVARTILARRKTDRERLFGLQRREKFDGAYDSKLAIILPFGECCDDFVKNHYAGHDWCAREMPRQAGMISADGAENFKVHEGNF
jgi:hypothetical protein